MTAFTPARLKSIARRYDLRLMILFGSQVSGHIHPESDIDIAVWAERPLNAEQRTQLWVDLSNRFQAEVDLTVLNHAEPLLLQQIATTGHLLYEDKRGAWLDFKGYAFRYYQDSKKLRDDLMRYLQREFGQLSKRPRSNHRRPASTRLSNWNS